MNKLSDHLIEFAITVFALVVTLGAGVWIDYKHNRDKEREYMHSMIHDLEADTSMANDYARKKDLETVLADTLCDLFETPKITPDRIKYIYYAARNLVPKWGFTMTDGTLQQLRAGGFNLIRNAAIVDSILAYTVEYNGVVALQSLEDARKEDYRQTIWKLFEVAEFRRMYDSNDFQFHLPTWTPKFLSLNHQDINEVLMSAHFIWRIEGTEAGELRKLSAQANSLITQIKAAYDQQ